MVSQFERVWFIIHVSSWVYYKKINCTCKKYATFPPIFYFLLFTDTSGLLWFFSRSLKEQNNFHFCFSLNIHNWKKTLTNPNTIKHYWRIKIYVYVKIPNWTSHNFCCVFCTFWLFLIVYWMVDLDVKEELVNLFLAVNLGQSRVWKTAILMWNQGQALFDQKFRCVPIYSSFKLISWNINSGLNPMSGAFSAPANECHNGVISYSNTKTTQIEHPEAHRPESLDLYRFYINQLALQNHQILIEPNYSQFQSPFLTPNVPYFGQDLLTRLALNNFTPSNLLPTQHQVWVY